MEKKAFLFLENCKLEQLTMTNKICNAFSQEKHELIKKNLQLVILKWQP